jgi:dTDP-4-dehydrorhamnose 3,5-epimerase
MRVTRLAIPDVLMIEPRVFEDPRGHLFESYHAERYAAHGIAVAFVQDNQSYSRAAGTVRGLHFQRPPGAQAKLVRVLRGAILDVAVDLRPASPSFGRHVAAQLSAAERTQLFVPAGFAHGFCTLEPDTEVHYKMSSLYAPELEAAVAWDDPDLAIAWPVAPAAAILSERDRAAPRLRDLPGPHR